MELKKVDHLLEELTALLGSLPRAGDDDAAAVQPAILNAVADYVEGVDPTSAALDLLQEALEAATDKDKNTLKQRMKAAGCSRALQLLRDTIQQATPTHPNT
ncbi:hypothetical protein JKF63_01735 [Porcisia hertigi]|uniref:Uncharacterized protein n=1 Tax=Porcisia hertigi TaxID=2761500 RepID=A0A836IGB3_9TRYP|nr:hypothetical protein JKF63_01735 [Porcisia hertigi]